MVIIPGITSFFLNMLEHITKDQLKGEYPDVQPGTNVRVHQRVKEGEKTRIQVFEGVVIARKHGKGMSAAVTVRRMVDGIGVERVFPLHSPFIEKIQVARMGKVRRAKLYYLRGRTKKQSRLRELTLELQDSAAGVDKKVKKASKSEEKDPE